LRIARISKELELEKSNLWQDFEERIVENEQGEQIKYGEVAPLRRAYFELIKSKLRRGEGVTKKMVAFEFGGGERLLWEITRPASNFYLSTRWQSTLDEAGFQPKACPYHHGMKDGGRHSALNREWAFPKKDCLKVRIESHQDLSRLLDLLIEHGSKPKALDTVSNTKVPTMSADDKNQTPKTKNLILYGPPGTGKTYATAFEAVKLCLGESEAEKFVESRTSLMAEYKRLAKTGRIEFVTFHQSFSYEDFVEGLRPTTGVADGEETNNSGFRLEPKKGVFRRIAERANESGKAPSSDESELISLEGRNFFQMSLGYSRSPADNIIFEEAIAQNMALFGYEDIDWSDPKYDDTGEILKACQDQGRPDYNTRSGAVKMADCFRNKVRPGDILIISKGNYQYRAIGEVLGEYEYHPREDGRYNHRRSVRWLWVDRDGLPVDEIHDTPFSQSTIYSLQNERLNVARLERLLNSSHTGEGAKLENPEQFVLIIDEINRANISKVFGELITLIEVDKRLGCDNALEVILPYSGDSFSVPKNLHIIGTMNTADRSIALLDTALRRRFEFKELMPKPELLPENINGVNLQTLLKTINQRIEYLFDREHQIGHAYFMGCQNRSDVDDVMRHKIIPLLAEYFYEDWSKVAVVLGDSSERFLTKQELNAPVELSDDMIDGKKQRWAVKAEFEDSDYAEFAAS
jgi:5-methylcytosine-specific restriction protein B